MKIGTVLIVIITTAVLHNIARLHGETIEYEIDDENTDDQDHDDEDGQPLQRNGDRMGVAVGNTIIRQYFTA